jgi:hypothetical protein
MITVQFSPKAGLAVRHVWLASEPLLRMATGFTVFYNCACTHPRSGFQRDMKRKLEVDVTGGGEAVLARMGQDARYKVRRAQREGGLITRETDMKAFLEFYNGFALSKSLPTMETGHLGTYWPHLEVTTMCADGERISSHAWVISKEERKASLLWAASSFRQVESSQKRNRLSRAHLLHYLNDMQTAADAGCTTYDFGYFGQVSEEMDAVNRFKSQFPCALVDVSTYTSLPLYLWTRLRRRAAKA